MNAPWISFDSFSSAVANQQLSGILAIWRNLRDDGYDPFRHAKAIIAANPWRDMPAARRASGENVSAIK
jgi:hypothetical protein